MTIGLIILIVLILLVIWGISLYNQMVGANEMVENAMAQIATQIESRWDALTNLIQATKNYQTHESETLTHIVEARKGITKHSTVKEVETDEQAFQQALRSIDVVVEQYPNLRAADIYQSTMSNVDKYENNVRQSRMIFNDTVTKFNRLIKTFPNSLIAGMTGFHPRDYFQNTSNKTEMPQW